MGDESDCWNCGNLATAERPTSPRRPCPGSNHGYAWRREGTARSGARVAVPSLCWTACCSVCGDLVEDEYIPHDTSPEGAAADAAGREWTELPDGRLVCERGDDARAQAASDDDSTPDENQLTFP